MKKSNKQKLVEYMIENGNNFRYTDMIKQLLKIVKGQDYQYNYRTDRGFYATNFTKRNGHMVKGGNCCVYKNPSGKWSAKFFSQEEILDYKISNIVKNLTREISTAVSDLKYKLDNCYTFSSRQLAHSIYKNTVEQYQKEATKKIFKLKK